MSSLRQTFVAIALTASVAAPMAFAPATADAAGAQTLKQKSQRRQKQKNTWRNIGLGSAAVGAYGFLKGDHKLGWLGAAGAGYSAWRYEQDRKSQRGIDDARRRSASNGRARYVTRYKVRNGKRIAYRVRVR